MTTICARCQSGNTKTVQEMGEMNYKGVSLPCEEIFTLCNNCDYEFVTTEQSKKWDVLADAAKRKYDNLLPVSEIKRIRNKIKLTQKEAGTIIGGGVMAFSKYENNKVTQSVAVDNLMRLVDEDPRIIKKLRDFRSQEIVKNSVFHVEMSSTLISDAVNKVTMRKKKNPKSEQTVKFKGLLSV